MLSVKVVDDDEDEEELDKPPSVHYDLSDKGNEKTRKDPPHVEQTPRKEQKVWGDDGDDGDDGDYDDDDDDNDDDAIVVVVVVVIVVISMSLLYR